MQEVILASQSPRRKMLLEWADLKFSVMVSDTEETYPAHLSITAIPVYIAQQKALAVKKQIQDTKPEYMDKWIVAADTIVVIDQQILGKPSSKEEAIHFLQILSDKTHQVITGVYLIKGAMEKSFFEITEVTFNPLTDSQIQYYVDKYQPFDKAGAYAIQEWIGVVGIQKIKGDFYNVMGLPVNRLLPMLT